MNDTSNSVGSSNELAAALILQENRYFTISTIAPDGPWCAPLSYVWIDGMDLVFYSSRFSKHSQNLQTTNTAAGAIFNSTLPSDLVDGLQLSGTVELVPEGKLENIHTEYFLKSFPDPDQRERWIRPTLAFTGESILRFYSLRLTQLFKLDLSTTAEDRRLPIDVEVIRNLMR